MKQEQIKAYQFARNYPEKRFYKINLSGNVRDLTDEIFLEFENYSNTRNQILENLPTLRSDVNVQSKRLLEIQREIPAKGKRQEYNPLEYFSGDELKGLIETLETLCIDDKLKYSVCDKGDIKLKRNNIYVHPNRLTNEDWGNLWGERFRGSFAAMVALGSISIIPTSITENSPKLSLLGAIVGFYFGAPLAALGGEFVGQNVGSKLGGKIPIRYYAKNPFEDIASEIKQRVGTIEERLAASKVL